MQSLNSVLALVQREFLITFRNFSEILSIFLFFLLGIMIFVFSVGIDNEIFSKIGIGIIWTIILLSNNLSIRKFYQDDFNDNSLILLHMSGLSYEIIVLVKIITIWLLIQLPFLIIIPIASLLLNLDIFNLQMIVLSFLIGSPIITCIASISGSMNLLNKKNFAIGSLIIMTLSIPVIIFGVSLVNASSELINPQIKILIGIMFFFLAITPWVSAACIKLSFQNK